MLGDPLAWLMKMSDHEVQTVKTLGEPLYDLKDQGQGDTAKVVSKSLCVCQCAHQPQVQMPWVSTECMYDMPKVYGGSRHMCAPVNEGVAEVTGTCVCQLYMPILPKT